MARAYSRSIWDDDFEARTRRGIMDGLGTPPVDDTGVSVAPGGGWLPEPSRGTPVYTGVAAPTTATPRETDVSPYTGLAVPRTSLAHPRSPDTPIIGRAIPRPAPTPVGTAVPRGTAGTEPGTPTTPGGLPPVLPGWDAVKWADPAHNTIK